MSTLAQRSEVIGLVNAAIAAGACQERACGAISLSERTLQRWQRDQSRGDQRSTRVQTPRNQLSEPERQSLLAVANSDEFGHLAPSQIVPRLVDAGQYIASESTFSLILSFFPSPRTDSNSNPLRTNKCEIKYARVLSAP